ncbi:MAG TPA: crotonase, partial [Pseudomonas sp.]|nr:crotonase [Pseudomonas sp.]
MTQAEAPVLIEVRNRVGYLTLNRPAGLNAVTLEMVRMLHRQLQQWADDQDVVAVMLRGAGEKAFCAGGDIRSLYDSYKSVDSLHREFFEEEYALDQYIHAYGKPLLALMNGFVLGGGMGLVQGASLRVISERTRMGMPEVGIGYFPDVGGSYFLSRLADNLGIYMGLTGKNVSSADALYAGLADYCVPYEQFAALEQALNRQDWSTPPVQALTNLLVSIGCIGRA